MRRLQQDDAVVTPMGKRARVIAIDAEGFCNIRYFDNGPDGQPQVTQVHERLLRMIYPGRDAPPPVRIDALGRRR